MSIESRYGITDIIVVCLFAVDKWNSSREMFVPKNKKSKQRNLLNISVSLVDHFTSFRLSSALKSPLRSTRDTYC